MQRHTDIYRSTIYLCDEIDDDPDLKETAIAINEFCIKHEVKGYHYTRAFPDEIRTKGLLCRTGEEIRNEFLLNHADIFTGAELQEVKEIWAQYFKGNQVKARDCRVYFNATKYAMNGPGSASLLGHFGGEQIHMPLNSRPELIEKLTALGEPLLVTFKTKGDIRRALDYEGYWGTVALSTYHRMVNSEADRHDVDAFRTEAVLPCDILTLTTL